MKVGIAKYDFEASVLGSSNEISIKKGEHMVILDEYFDNGYWFVDEFGSEMAERPWKAYAARLLNGLKVDAIYYDALEVID